MGQHVSRNPRGESGFGQRQFRKTSKKEMVLDKDSSHETPEGKTVLNFVRREHEQQRPHPQYNEREIFFAWVLVVAPVFTSQLRSLNFIFCEFLRGGLER